MKIRRSAGWVLCLWGTMALILWGILFSLLTVGTDAALYHRLQIKAREDICEYAGLSEDDLIRVDEALAQCLMGDPSALSNLEADVFGICQRAFNDRELRHMEDCRKLFDLARRVKNLSIGIGSLMLIVGMALLKKRKMVRLAAWLAPVMFMLPLGALAIWAAMDFNSAFCFFHRCLFTNDLWLLNPETDLLIRICPQDMFVNMGLRIGLMSFGFALGIPAVVSRAAGLIWKKQ